MITYCGLTMHKLTNALQIFVIYRMQRREKFTEIQKVQPSWHLKLPLYFTNHDHENGNGRLSTCPQGYTTTSSLIGPITDICCI